MYKRQPSSGRGPSGAVWKLEDSLWPFVELVAGVLSDEPLFFLINSYTTGLAPSVLAYILESLITPKYGGRTRRDELGLPVTESGLALPLSLIHIYAGTKRAEDGRILTSGGRVLGVTAVGPELKSAITCAYHSAKHISFTDLHFRTDIGRT